MKKVISLLLVAIVCFSFAGCTKKSTVNVSTSPTLLGNDKDCPTITGLDYGMSKNAVFKVLGVKETNASKKEVAGDLPSNLKGDSYIFDNVTINNMSCSINLFFINDNSTFTELKNAGLYHIILVVNDSEKAKLEKEFTDSGFKYSGGDLGHWNKELTVKSYMDKNNLDYDKYASLSIKLNPSLSEDQAKEILKNEPNMSGIGAITADGKYRLDFNGFTCLLINISQK